MLLGFAYTLAYGTPELPPLLLLELLAPGAFVVLVVVVVVVSQQIVLVHPPAAVHSGEAGLLTVPVGQLHPAELES